jgi:hypothetical protein
MSSERGVRNSSAVSPRVPGEGFSTQGKSGAKARPKGVVDAQQVDIPVPAHMSDGGTQEDRWTQALVDLGEACRARSR